MLLTIPAPYHVGVLVWPSVQSSIKEYALLEYLFSCTSASRSRYIGIFTLSILRTVHWTITRCVGMYLISVHHQCVLPKDRFFTASAGTKAAVLPKTELPLQIQEPRLQFYQGWIGAVASRTPLSLASEQTLKDPRGPKVDARRVD